MDRRTYIASVASGSIAFGTGYALFHRGTQQATAQVSTESFDIAGDSVTTSDGYIQNVSVTVSGGWSYELPGGDVTEWKLDLRVSDGDTWNTIGQVTGTNEYHQYNESYEVSGNLIEDGPFSQEFFAAPGPGKQTSVEMPFEIWFRVLTSDGTPLADASKEDTATIAVGQEEINANLYGEVGGSGSVTITK